MMSYDTNAITPYFVCLECQPNFVKILKVNEFVNFLPFDIEENIGTYERNLQSPYFECGPTDNLVDKCEFYFNSLNKLTFSSKLFLSIII